MFLRLTIFPAKRTTPPITYSIPPTRLTQIYDFDLPSPNMRVGIRGPQGRASVLRGAFDPRMRPADFGILIIKISFQKTKIAPYGGLAPYKAN